MPNWVRMGTPPLPEVGSGGSRGGFRPVEQLVKGRWRRPTFRDGETTVASIAQVEVDPSMERIGSHPGDSRGGEGDRDTASATPDDENWAR